MHVIVTRLALLLEVVIGAHPSFKAQCPVAIAPYLNEVDVVVVVVVVFAVALRRVARNPNAPSGNTHVHDLAFH
jgi:hypothetical protein